MNRLFHDVEVLWISRFDYEQTWYLQSHTHTDFYQLMYVCEGACILKIGDQVESVEAPKIIFIPPENDHEILQVLSSRLVTLDVKFKVQHEDSTGILKRIPRIASPKGEQLKNILEHIIEEGFIRSGHYQEMCSLLMGLALLMLIRWNDEITYSSSLEIDSRDFFHHNTTNLLTQAMMKYLQDHYAEKITSDDLSTIFNYSYRHLSEVFHNDMHMSPLAFQEKVRIARAKDLMNYTQFELKQICSLAGFSTVHQFSKRFKMNEGLPPGQWREMHRQHIREDVCINPKFVNHLYVNHQQTSVPD